MSFLDRYEFEQILDEDSAIKHNQWQVSEEKIPQQQLSATPKFQIRIWRTVLIGLTSAGLGFSLQNQPSFASHPQLKSNFPALTTLQK